MQVDSHTVASVIIPHLNQEEALARCIQSLEQQSYDTAAIEVIVVDNGSKRLPEVSSSAFSRFELLSETEPGPGPARNKGVAASNGRYLFFIDADCLAHKDWINTGLECLEQDETSPDGRKLLGGDVRIVLADPARMTTLEAYETMFAYRQEAYIKQHGFSGSGNLAIWREAFDDIGPFPGIDVAEDRGWGRAAVKAGYSFAWTPGMRIYHPARESFEDIYKKWDRHTRHDLNEMIEKGPWRSKWLLRLLLVLLSIPVHGVKTLLSDRLDRASWRLKAVAALGRIRFFRTGLMLRLFLSEKARKSGVSWNRD